MVKEKSIFNKGSILPYIIELEAEFIEQENEALKLADEEVRQAQLSGEKCIEDTRKEIPVIEEEERRKILDAYDSETEKLMNREEQEYHELEQCIIHNRNNALNFILNKVIPQRNGR